VADKCKFALDMSMLLRTRLTQLEWNEDWGSVDLGEDARGLGPMRSLMRAWLLWDGGKHGNAGNGKRLFDSLCQITVCIFALKINRHA